MKKMKLKNTTNKKKNYKLIIIIYLLIIYTSFSYTFYYFMKNNKNITNEEFINFLINGGNANILRDYKIINIVNSTMKLIFNIDFTNPISILNNSILKYGTPSNSAEVINISYNDDYSDMEELKDISDYISDPNPTVISSPIIYLYNSHQLENYSSESLEIYGITPNVLMASYLLKEKLNNMGLNTIVEDENMSEILSLNGWDYSYSYQASRTLIQNKIEKYPTLEYFIDIHRDSVTYDYTNITIDNITYAKILFVIGKDYDTWENNYSFASELNNLFNEYYPGLSRGILTKTGLNVNGVYNQDLNNKVILIELGGVDNNIDEVNNTLNAIADILYKYIKD